MATPERIHSRDILLEMNDLQCIMDILSEEGYTILGPRAGKGAITCSAVSSIEDLPTGWRDEQVAGTYRIMNTGTDLIFGYGPAADSWKRFLFPPQAVLFQAELDSSSGFRVSEIRSPVPRYAFLGIRSCDLCAINFLDRVFMGDGCQDAEYSQLRETMVIIAVDCTHPGGTCFCTSMNTGPRALSGFDIALTEVAVNNAHYFVARPGTSEGEKLLSRTGARPASENEKNAADELLGKAVETLGPLFETSGLSFLVKDHFDHPGWQRIAGKCFTCGSCTMVCPTCFCTQIQDTNSIDGALSRRKRTWDSCFSMAFSYIHGGIVRSTPMSRYRQWMTHKLCTSIDQFGVSACVGCGRCITWCPAGIDLRCGAGEILGETRSETENN